MFFKAGKKNVITNWGNLPFLYWEIFDVLRPVLSREVDLGWLLISLQLFFRFNNRTYLSDLGGSHGVETACDGFCTTSWWECPVRLSLWPPAEHTSLSHFVVTACQINILTPTPDMDRHVSKRVEPSSHTAFMAEQRSTSDVLPPQDVMSQYRGAKPPRRCELLGEVSPLS